MLEQRTQLGLTTTWSRSSSSEHTTDKYNITIASFIEIYLNDFLFPQVKIYKKTNGEYGIADETHNIAVSQLNTVCSFIGKKMLQKITSKEIETLQNDLRIKYSSPYAIHLMDQLKRVFNKAISWNYIKLDPMEDLERPRIKKPEVIPYSIGEVNRMLKKADEMTVKHPCTSDWRSIPLI